MADIKFCPSILSADFGRLMEEIKEVEDVAQSIHVDVMDGHFVPNITIGPVVSNCLTRSNEISISLNIHLMISDPEKYAPMFEVRQDDTITFHIETTPTPRKLIHEIRKRGAKVGVSLNPDTEPDSVLEILDVVDEVLVMTVYPGFGGQQFMESMLNRISLFRDEIDSADLDAVISVDGGINESTIAQVVDAGVDIIIAGSAIFGRDDRVAAIESLRRNAYHS